MCVHVFDGVGTVLEVAVPLDYCRGRQAMFDPIASSVPNKTSGVSNEVWF